ncbi:enoyl-CoA hydratase/isomerase family protein [Amycolatopsis alkalitolerans]|uniref:Enoyl-CoA hydratase/isomerase family protein n=1 Tax=Amycolatopsis alkalitolerans TaxID=2547244 RepID=A0A5C4M7H5_9PSEU|nr:enoyl-CoA hydratase/isomerase family protein [Amycolatopsis alkalitolerans]TNC29224.1 enoyl-CoA hydratase/isomerase family protein [Amycolatopsis alkalitolerans]
MAELVNVSADAATRVGVVTMCGAPNNYLNRSVLDAVLDGLRTLDDDPRCDAIVLVAEGKHFCAGRDFTAPRGPGDDSASVYRTAASLFDIATPWLAAVRGGAIGAGFGLALAADFRVCAADAYFWPNFVTLGLHHGFGTTVTLPRLVGPQRAARMLMSGAKIGVGTEAATGLTDAVVPTDELVSAAVAFAEEFARNPAPAVRAVRATMRAGLRDQFAAAAEHESTEQSRLTNAKKTTTESGNQEKRA